MWLIILGLIFPAHGAQCRHTDKRLSCVEYVNNYDGDTITFTIPRLYPLFGEHVRIRLKGVDTPEIKASKACERDLALKVKEKVRAILSKAERIDLVNPKRDKYFRILADVQADGISVGEYLLKKGWGVVYNGEKKSNHNWCSDKGTILEHNISSLDFSLPHEPYQGRFEFSGELEPSQLVHSVRIYMNGEEARKKMLSLINKGYICEKRLGNMMLCRQLTNLEHIPEDIAEQMRSQAQQMQIEFAPYEGGGSLIAEGESFREWEIPGSVIINGEEYESYIFSKQSSGLIKVMMGYETGQTRYSFVAKDNNLKYFVRVLAEQKWEWNEYTALAVFHPSASE